MATVKSLIEFYNNQNTLDARAAEATAANKTSANIESARIGQDAKRLQQEKQLEFFRQKMEDLRAARAQGTAEQIATRDISARQQAAVLSQTAEESQNAAQRDFQLNLAKMNMAGDDAREESRALTEAPLREAQLQEAQAGTAEKVARAGELGKPSLKEIIDGYTAIKKQSVGIAGLNPFFEGKAEKSKRIQLEALDVLAKQYYGMGVKESAEYQETPENSKEVMGRVQSLRKEMESGDWAKTVIKTGAVSLVTKRWTQLQSKLASGAIAAKDRNAAIKYFQDYAKSVGVTDSDIVG